MSWYNTVKTHTKNNKNNNEKKCIVALKSNYSGTSLSLIET